MKKRPSAFAALLRLAGFTMADAARIFNVSLNAVQNWGSGRGYPPRPVIDALRSIIVLQEGMATDVISSLSPTRRSVVVWPASDEIARLGYPDAACVAAVVARVLAALPLCDLIDD